MEAPVVNLSVKNVPHELAERLRQRAERNHRSLQRELLAILEQAVAQPGGGAALTPEPRDPGKRYISIDEAYQRAKQLFPNGSPSSVEFIRRSRDARYGEEWAETGEQPDVQ
jgi:plasmid stability protein